MSRAEEAAMKAYPKSTDGALDYRRANYRIAYKRGYEQAEKDLALTWEDIRFIHEISEDVWKPNMEDERPIYEEALRKFNELKKG